MTLFRTLILRPLLRDRLRTILSILSLALGVAVIVAIQLASDAATGSFRSSMETLGGRTDLEIRANGEIDERFMGTLSALPIDAHFSPVMETRAAIPGIGAVPVYGVDALGLAPGQAIVSRTLADRGAGAMACQLAGRTVHLHIGRIDPTPGEFLAFDIADFQQLVNRYGKLDRIDVAFGPGEDPARAEQAIRAALPASYLIEPGAARTEESRKMVRAFGWNLRMLSYISLLVGAFLIYNTIAISVVRRREEIGTLRALGANRVAVLAIFLAEALVLGLLGAALGLLIGRVLAGVCVGMIADTVNALYATSRPAAIELTWGRLWSALLTGAIVSLAAAWGPAREAVAIAPTEAMSRGAHEHRARLRWRRALAWAVCCALAAAALSRVRPLAGYPVGAYAAAIASVAAAAFATPALVLAAQQILRPVLGKWVEGALAARGLEASLARTTVVVAALGTAISMMAAVGLMVGSFRETVLVWLDVQLRADLYVRPLGPMGADVYAPIPPRALDAIAATPGIAAFDVFTALPISYQGERATLGAGNMEIVRRFGRLRFLPGEDREEVLRSLPGRDRAVVSEPFANKHAIAPGDVIVLPLGDRTVRLTVAGIYYEYSSSQGYVIVDRSTLLKYLPSEPATNVAVYVARGADPERVRRALQLAGGDLGIEIYDNRYLRRTSMKVFDRTFAITWALEAVAIVVAMLGAANSLLALVLDRRRELAVLRYLGASRPQIRTMVLAEAGLLGLFAAILGTALGFVLSLLLIFVVNKQSFGWTIQFHPPNELLAGAILLVWLTTVLAALYPARIAAAQTDAPLNS
jgi:putative ABC transport system permease protein